MRIQSSKDVTVSANRTMRKIVCQCVRGLHLRDNNTFVLFAPSRTRGPPLPNLYDLKSFLDSACALAAGVVDAHELLLETNELPSSSQHSKSRPATKWNHRGLRRRMPEWRIWHHCQCPMISDLVGECLRRSWIKWVPKSPPAAWWIHWHSRRRGNHHSGSCSSLCSIGRSLDHG